MASVLTHSFSGRYPRNPTSADRQNRRDECGGCGVPLCSLAGMESCFACIRGRQRHRTFLSGSSVVEISSHYCTRGRGKAGCPCRGSLVIRAGCLSGRLRFGWDALRFVVRPGCVESRNVHGHCTIHPDRPSKHCQTAASVGRVSVSDSILLCAAHIRGRSG